MTKIQDTNPNNTSDFTTGTEVENKPVSQEDVGYRKPPVGTRFKKGQSGNPAGRPIGRKNIKTIIREVQNASVVIEDNGQTMRVSKFEAAIRALAEKAQKGDIQSIKLFLKLVEDVEAYDNRPFAGTGLDDLFI